jgi:hypothetical protein
LAFTRLLKRCARDDRSIALEAADVWNNHVARTGW